MFDYLKYFITLITRRTCYPLSFRHDNDVNVEEISYRILFITTTFLSWQFQKLGTGKAIGATQNIRAGTGWTWASYLFTSYQSMLHTEKKSEAFETEVMQKKMDGDEIWWDL